MKKRILMLLLPFAFYLSPSFAQTEVNDEAIRYQSQRMVFQQWNQNDFKPGKGFLDTNPYYWLVWGFFDPNYHKTDLRPLSPTGPQTQRLALVGSMNGTDNQYKLHSDTVRNTALSQIANQSGLLSDADPLWVLYYNQQLSPVINNSMVSILAGLSPQVSSNLISTGLYSWYKNELDMLKQRIQSARTTNMDRGSRIMAYYRFLNEYRKLSGVWAIRTSATQTTLDMTAHQQALQKGSVTINGWTPQSDVKIANSVLQNAQY